MFWLLFGSELATKGKEMAAKKDSSIQIIEINTQVAEVCIVGTTPMVQNCMSQKAKMQLLLPPKRKTAADKATTLKHNPLREFRDSIHKCSSGPTRIGVPA